MLRWTFLRDVWQYRELLLALVARNLKVRYQRSTLGFLWALLNPAFTVLILAVVFRAILRIDLPDYWAFLISGYFPWVFVLHTLGTSAYVVTSHSYMIRSVPFPTEVLMLSAVLARLVEFVVEYALVLILIAIGRHGGIPASYLLVPLAVVLLTLVTTAILMPVSAMAVFFHDVQHGLPVVLTLLAFLSPVYYPLTFVPESLRPILMFNPFVPVLDLFRVIVYEGAWPSPLALAGTTVMAVVAFVIGTSLMRWKQAYFAEVV